jgi:hypothetical protein
MGVGAFRDWGEIDRYIRISSVARPDAGRHRRYRQLFALYREIYEALKDKYPRLARN